MRTVPLHGKRAAGRVARVDDEDYEIVSRYRWHVCEKPPKGTGRGSGPYAQTVIGKRSVFMHVLIMGRPYIDHEDHDGLNNQRYNLRPADQSQNNQNQRPQLGRTSQFKGVRYIGRRGVWQANIKLNGQSRHLGDFASELQAAYAYDAAAREMFGKFACPNFPDEPTQAMRDEWQALDAAWRAGSAARFQAAGREATRVLWAERKPRTCVCVICGEKYQTRSMRESFYCSNACQCKAAYRRHRERNQPEPRACAGCGEEFQPASHKKTLFCSPKCWNKEKRRRARERASLEQRQL